MKKTSISYHQKINFDIQDQGEGAGNEMKILSQVADINQELEAQDQELHKQHILDKLKQNNLNKAKEVKQKKKEKAKFMMNKMVSQVKK